MKKLFLTVVAMLGATTLFAQTDIVTLVQEATANAKSGNLEVAISQFDDVILGYLDIEEPTPNDDKALAMAQKFIVTCNNMLGGNAYNAKDYDSAIKYFEEAASRAQLYDNLSDMNKNLQFVGKCYEAKGAEDFNNGNYAAAIETFAKGYAADKFNTSMALNLAESYFRSDLYQDGMRICTEIKSLNPDKFADAIATAQQKMDMYTNNEIAKLQEANNYDGIIEMATMLPDPAMGQKVLMQAYHGKKEYNKMIEMSAAALEAQTTDEGRSDIYYLLGLAYNELNKLDKATEAMSHVTVGNKVANAKAFIKAAAANATANAQ